VEAAFFDLDKTVISKASMMAFGSSFYRAGLIGKRALARGLLTQVVFVRFGASAETLARLRSSALALTEGWDQAEVRQIVVDALNRVIDPITYPEAMELIREHRSAGRRVYIVSAAPAEIVEPLADHLGVHEAIASQAAVDHRGRYTGEMERYTYGPAKAEVMRLVADRDGIDLTSSWAYTDSATDLPMLEAVGHPVAVNPDRTLRRIADQRGWPVLRFNRIVAPDLPGGPAATGPSALPAPSDARPPRLAVLQTDLARRRVLLPAVAILTTGVGATAWWARRRPVRSA
jgi:HAD superfamily hydrolase (TIGR01490 family)